MHFPQTNNYREIPSSGGHPADQSLIQAVPVRGPSPVLLQSPPPQTAADAYLKVLWAHKTAFALSALICLGLAVLITFAATPVYRARGSLELQTPPGSAYQMREGDAAASNGPTFDAYLDTQIGILHSDTIIRRVADKLRLADRMNDRRRGGLSGWIAAIVPFGKEPYTRETAFEAAKKRLIVRQSRLDNLVEILYDDPDPGLAAQFVNAVATEYTQENLESRWRMAQNTGNWLAGHLDDMRVKLEASEKALQDYSQKNNLLFVADKDSIAGERLQQLQQELSQAQADRVQHQSQAEMATAVSPDAVPEVVDNPALKEYQIKIADLERQLAEDKQIYTAGNPKVQALNSQIESLRTAYSRQRDSVLARVHNDYDASSRREKMLAQQYSRQAKVVSDQDEKMIRYDTLKHEVETNRSTYEGLLQRVKESSVSVALQATNVRVVDEATPPAKPYKPNTPINLASGLLAGMIMGLTSVALRHRGDRRVRRPEVMRQYLGTRELGVIPATRVLATTGSPATSLKPEGVALGKPQAWLEPNSQVSEAFRSVMTSMLFARGNPARLRVVVITSSVQGEGKTTVASNLGAALAATGRKVLVVDGDTRRPRLHRAFNLPSSPGLLEFSGVVLGGAGTAVDYPELYTRPTGVTDLSIMPCGASQPGVPDLMQTMRFREVFDALRPHFDTILVDAPPVLCVSEARAMAGAADGVVLVVRAESTSVDEAVETEARISEHGGHVLGAVLNAAAEHANPYHTYYARYATPAATA